MLRKEKKTGFFSLINCINSLAYNEDFKFGVRTGSIFCLSTTALMVGTEPTMFIPDTLAL